MDSLNHFASHKVNVVLKNYEEKSLATLTISANKEVSKSINDKIQNNIAYITKNSGKEIKVRDFDRNKFDNKIDYLIAIGNDKQLINYLSPAVMKHITHAHEE